MSDATDLHVQIAQRLFGWTYTPHHTLPVSVWRDPAGGGQAAPPAYTTDPAATVQVWQWLETRPFSLEHVAFEYRWQTAPVICALQLDGDLIANGTGATWPEALCRAALALAERLEQETP